MNCSKSEHDAHVLKALVFLTSYISSPSPDSLDAKHSLTHLLTDYRLILEKNLELGNIASEALKHARNLEKDLADTQKSYADLRTSLALDKMRKPN